MKINVARIHINFPLPRTVFISLLFLKDSFASCVVHFSCWEGKALVCRDRAGGRPPGSGLSCCCRCLVPEGEERSARSLLGVPTPGFAPRSCTAQCSSRRHTRLVKTRRALSADPHRILKTSCPKMSAPNDFSVLMYWVR